MGKGELVDAICLSRDPTENRWCTASEVSSREVSSTDWVTEEHCMMGISTGVWAGDGGALRSSSNGKFSCP